MKDIIIKACKGNGKMRYGLGNVELKDNKLIVSYGGNMGAGMSEVNMVLSKLGLPFIEEMKKEMEVLEEEGSPDYMYVIKFNID